MVRRSAIAFDQDLPIDTVVFAVAPIDAFTGRVITDQVEARIDGLPDRPIRNHSGLLVFINLPDRPGYTIRITAERAGYFDPEPVEFTPPAPGEVFDAAERLRLVVPLSRRPTFDFEDEVTLVSGVVVNGTTVASSARVEATLLQGVAPRNVSRPSSFGTRTDQRGAFALALRLPAIADNAGETVNFRIAHEDAVRQFEREVKESRRHVFNRPIDLTSDEVPELLAT